MTFINASFTRSQLQPAANLLRAGLLVLFFLLPGLLLTLPAAAQTDTPTVAVKSVVNSILAILRKPDFEMTVDRPAISAAIKRAFDDTAMAQSVLSTNWRQASSAQQTEFKALLLSTIESSYLGRIKAYTNESVEFRAEEIRANRATVNTMIIASSGEIPVNYKLRKRSDGWFVYDVEVENVSMVSSYRDSYLNVVSRDGIDGLLEQMRAKLPEATIIEVVCPQIVCPQIGPTVLECAPVFTHTHH